MAVTRRNVGVTVYQPILIVGEEVGGGRMDEGQGRWMDAAAVFHPLQSNPPPPNGVLVCLPDVSNAIQRQPPLIPRLISDPPPLYSPLTHLTSQITFNPSINPSPSSFRAILPPMTRNLARKYRRYRSD